jgi:hypothetical protein
VRRALAVVAVALLTGCGLPTPDGVQSAGEISPDQQTEGLQTRPSGPQADAGPVQIVRGFLAAQSYPDEDYAVARSFLAPGAAWDVGAGVQVLDDNSTGFTPVEEPTRATVEARRDVVGQVRADGWSEPLDDRETFDYELVKVQEQWRLAKVPPGLTLTETERDRSLVPVPVMFLSRSPGPVHLVSDLVRVPNDDQLARRLVSQVLDGPSSGLTVRSAGTAVPVGTTLLSVTEPGPGQVTVDLSAAVSDLGDQARRDLSAQLLWTLRLGLERASRTFNGMQLLVEGSPLEVDGEDGPQGRDTWQDLDPGGREGAPDALAVASGGRVVRVPDTGSPATALDPGVVRVVEAVQDASGSRVAVLTNPPEGDLRTLSVGVPPGPFTPVRRNEVLQSPTWGDGAYGVWALRRGDDPAVVVGEPGRAREVTVEGGLHLSATSVLRVSRDGARVALVDDSGRTGPGGAEVRRLRIGRVQPDGDGLRIVDLEQVSEDDVDVRDVAWVDGTTVLALGGIGADGDSEAPSDIPRPLLEIDADGVSSERSSLNTAVDLSTTTLTAYGDSVLVAANYPKAGATSERVLAVFRRVNAVFPDSGALPNGFVRPRLPD